MPELPEVETVRRGLAPVLEGARFTRVQANRPDLRRPLPRGFATRLTGQTVRALERRAKYLLARLADGEVLVVHLGMTGRFVVTHGASRTEPGSFYVTVPVDDAHTHVVFETDRGARVEYNDPRRFGLMLLIREEALARHPVFRDMGPEPLGADFTAAHLAAVFRGRRQSIKVLLLDQHIVAGIGNIYACEALHVAGISPKRPAGGVSPVRLARLAEGVRQVLTESIEHGATTLTQDGAVVAGGTVINRFRVYDREGEPCVRPGCGGRVTRIVQAGRSTFYCSRCQR